MTTARPWMAVTAVVAGLLATAASASAQTQTFTGGAPLSFGEMQATPYPSTLDVSGVSGTITDVNVILNGVSLTATNVDMLLESPTGNAVLLTSDVPTTGIVSQTWTFDDQAVAAQAIDQLTGIFQPTNLSGGLGDLDTLPAPASPEFDSSLSALDGLSPDGTWKLYAAGSGLAAPLGSITSWALEVTTNAAPAPVTAPGIAVDPAAIDFGTVTRQSIAPRSLTITNTGTAPLTVKLPDFFSADFALTNQNISLPDIPCGLLPVQPGQSCKTQVVFTPVTAGLKTATASIESNAAGSPTSVPLTGTLAESSSTSQNQPPQDTGSPEVAVQQADFVGPPVVGQPTFLHVQTSDDKQPVTGVVVNFGEALGLYGASACRPGMKPGDASFDIPYTFLTPGQHTITVTVFAGGCGKSTAHTTTFTTVVNASNAAKAARRMATTADTIVGPDITSKCKNASMLPSASKKKAKLVLKALLCVMNEQRKLAKLKPLKLSKKLGKAASAHSKAMIAGKFFAHQGPKEKALAARLKQAKYRGAAGENIGAGAGQLASPVQMVNGWMHSTLHRANLLSRTWKTVGIGYVARFPLSAANPAATYTTDFGTKP